MPQGLDVSGVVSATVTLDPQAAQFANFDSLLIMGDSNVIDTIERIRTYGDMDGVSADFDISDPEWLAAQDFFSQSPQPDQLYIGRWAQSATSGTLKGAILNATQQAMANFTPIVNGGVDFLVDGVARNLTGLNFSAASNLNAVATDITTALAGHATCIWDGERFQVISSTTGAASAVAFATAGAGTDISTLLGLLSTSGGYLIPGIIAESALQAVVILDNLTTGWYGLTVASTHVVDADHLAIAAYIQSASPHIYGVTTQETTALDPVSTADIGYQLKAAGYTRTCGQYSSSSPYAVASLLGREFTVDFGGNGTVITLFGKQEPGVTAETLTQNQANALNGKRYNYFANFKNGVAIICNAMMFGPVFIDEIHTTDWFANAVQTNLFNVLYDSETKIPQTDDGTHQLVTVAEATCKAAVTNGMAAPGTWNGPSFGTLKTGDYLPTGFYVYCQPIDQQAPADRAARKSPPIQIAIKLAGAIQSISAMIFVNR